MRTIPPLFQTVQRYLLFSRFCTHRGLCVSIQVTLWPGYPRSPIDQEAT